MMKDAIRTWLTEQFGDDPSLHEELYGQYAADMKSTLAEVLSLAEASNAPEIGEKAHAMKGMALQMGDSDVAAACLELQNAGRAGDIENCGRIIESVRSLVGAL